MPDKLQNTKVQIDTRSALDTIRKLNFIRVCGSEGESRGMDVLTRLLDEIGVKWRYHTFTDRWIEPVDPHLLLCGRKIPVRPAKELAFFFGADFTSNHEMIVDVQAPIATVGDCIGKIALAEKLDLNKPIYDRASAQLLACPFDPAIEPYLWAPEDAQKVPVAFLNPDDIPFISDAIGQDATLQWSVRSYEREFCNLVAEIPGNVNPDEVIVMGAHIDSWPGTVGASDDAAGCAVLVEAVKWFVNNPPARTVRFVWFTGEEVDGRGSRAYVRDCVKDPGAIKLMVCVDSGGCERNTGPHSSYTSDETTIEWARKHLDLGDMHNHIVQKPGTDAKAFIDAGIPVFAVEAPCKQSAHLSDDTPDNIDPQKVQIMGDLSLQASVHAATVPSPIQNSEFIIHN